MTHPLIELAERCERVVWANHDPGYPERLGVEINEELGIASYITDDGNPVLSIDAAMSLYEGVGTDFVLKTRDEHDGFRAIVWAGGRSVGYDAEAATPALALTAASLRARAAQEGRS